MKGLKGKALVQVERKYDDEIVVAGKTIYVERAYDNKDWHRVIHGKVVWSEELQKDVVVYFHYLQTESPVLDVMEGQGSVYCMDAHMLFCYVVDDQIHMLNDYVLVDIEMATKRSSIIIDPFDRENVKSGVLRAIGKTDLNCRVGNRVVMSNHSNFKNEIEGVEYYVMKQDDLLAVYEDTEDVTGNGDN